jgi:hypothetical protein
MKKMLKHFGRFSLLSMGITIGILSSKPFLPQELIINDAIPDYYFSRPQDLAVIIEEDIPFLYDSATGNKQPITKEFQLGSPSYRIEGLINEGADQLIFNSSKLVDLLYANPP